MKFIRAIRNGWKEMFISYPFDRHPFDNFFFRFKRGFLEEYNKKPEPVCEQCGQSGAIECVLYNSKTKKEDKEFLCFEHAVDGGYCGGCGNFWAGATSFDLSRIPGYCENCIVDIENDWDDYYEQDEYDIDGGLWDIDPYLGC